MYSGIVNQNPCSINPISVLFLLGTQPSSRLSPLSQGWTLVRLDAMLQRRARGGADGAWLGWWRGPDPTTVPERKVKPPERLVTRAAEMGGRKASGRDSRQRDAGATAPPQRVVLDLCANGLLESSEVCVEREDGGTEATR